jgi:hypothetical protein
VHVVDLDLHVHELPAAPARRLYGARDTRDRAGEVSGDRLAIDAGVWRHVERCAAKGVQRGK